MSRPHVRRPATRVHLAGLGRLQLVFVIGKMGERRRARGSVQLLDRSKRLVVWGQEMEQRETCLSSNARDLANWFLEVVPRPVGITKRGSASLGVEGDIRVKSGFRGGHRSDPTSDLVLEVVSRRDGLALLKDSLELRCEFGWEDLENSGFRVDKPAKHELVTAFHIGSSSRLITVFGCLLGTLGSYQGLDNGLDLFCGNTTTSGGGAGLA